MHVWPCGSAFALIPGRNAACASAGLACDFARILLDFGLSAVKGDISTDGEGPLAGCIMPEGSQVGPPSLPLPARLQIPGRWCFLIFDVELSQGTEPRWAALQRRIEATVPQGSDTVLLRRAAAGAPPPSPGVLLGPVFMLQITSYNRPGVLHSLVDALWEAELLTHKAHITTSPGNEVLDMFW